MDKYEQAQVAVQEMKELKRAVKELTRMDMERARYHARLVRQAENLHDKYPAVAQWPELAKIFGVSRITLNQWRKDAAVILGDKK